MAVNSESLQKWAFWGKSEFDKSETAVVKSEPDNSEPFEAKVSQAKVRQLISGGLGLQ
jgi:hypothetical protein